ncbi:MAG: hypothetical protein ACNYPI_09150 [Arenicellales bacterium WSBS_2016_MAG_OTU3]
MNQDVFNAIETRIKNSGFNLFARFTPAQIDDCLAETDITLNQSEQLWLLGNAGPGLWSHLTPAHLSCEHPIDEYSITTISAILDDLLAGKNYRFVYPGDSLIPLQQLGILADWCQPSKLGVGISPEFGTWFAYRIAVIVGPLATLEPVIRSPSPDVCAACVDAPCIAACPVSAVKNDKFEREICARRRLSENSDCAKTCAARAACPVGQDFRYGHKQIEYHGTRSLTSLRKYYV